MRISRAWILLLACVAVRSPEASAQSLTVRLDRDQLRVAAPRTHFLAGEPLERLHNGASVNYVFQVVVSAERSGRALARIQQRFAVSYDLWEEKFAVSKLGASPRSVSHLSAAAAEAWCLDNLPVAAGNLPADGPFWIRLEFRTEDAKESADSADNSGLTLSGLIDIFSKRSRDDRLRGYEEAGPFRLAEIKKKR